jgi:multidrug resistance efflux pump
MLWIVLSGMGGVAAGFLAAALLAANRVSEAEHQAAAVTRAVQDLALLKARIRAVQHNAKQAEYKGERTYVVQTPSGRFGKFNLPEV